jgi:hypothetical protein
MLTKMLASKVNESEGKNANRMPARLSRAALRTDGFNLGFGPTKGFLNRHQYASVAKLTPLQQHHLSHVLQYHA